MKQPAYKRSYHPLVIFFFYADMLDKSHLELIPSTTIDYWKSHDHTGLYGYEWVRDFYSEYHYFNSKVKRNIIFRALRRCSRILNCFTSSFSALKEYDTILKKNARKVIETIDYISSELSLKTACRIFHISTHQYYRWKNKIHCSASVLNLCFKTHPHQLTVAESTVISDAVNNPGNNYFPRVSIYYSLLNAGRLFCSLTTFYKYAHSLFSGVKIKRVKKKSVKLHASRIFEYLHIDTTLVPTLNEGVKRVVFVKDNFSKALLYKAIVPDGKSGWIAGALKQTFLKHNLMDYHLPIHIVSDQGPENKGEVLNWIDGLDKPGMVVKKTAGTSGFAYSNNAVESSFNIFKNEFSVERMYKDEPDLKKGLEEYEIYYNCKRYPKELYGLLPLQVLNGEIPDKNKFKDRIRDEKKTRYEKNKRMRFCDVCR